jgi:hypothetical protein
MDGASLTTLLTGGRGRVFERASNVMNTSWLCV